MPYFSVRGATSVADIYTGGGQNPYIPTNSQCYHYSIANFDGGMAGFAPPGSATAANHSWLNESCPINYSA